MGRVRGSSGGTEAEALVCFDGAGWRLFRRLIIVRDDEVDAARAGTFAIGGEVGVECCWSK